MAQKTLLLSLFLLFRNLLAVDKFYALIQAIWMRIWLKAWTKIYRLLLCFSLIYKNEIFTLVFARQRQLIYTRDFLHYLSEISQHQRVKGFMNNSTQLMCNYPATWYFKVLFLFCFTVSFQLLFLQGSGEYWLKINAKFNLKSKTFCLSTLTLKTTT